MIKQLKKAVVESVPSKNTFALFDVLISSKTTSATVMHQQRGNEIHANAARFLEVLTPKTFVQKNKKKKKMSILKKRILLERLKKHIELKLMEQATMKLNQSQSLVGVILDIPTDSLFHVNLFNFLTLDEIEDEDEKSEVVSNIKDILSPFFNSVYSLEIISQEVTHKVSSCYISVAFISECSAMSAISAIDGLVFSGSAIRAALSNNNEFVEKSIGHDHTSITTSCATISSQKMHSNTGFFVLYLENLLTASDVSDEDEVQEVLDDLHTLCDTCFDSTDNCESMSSISRLWIEKRARVDSGSLNESLPAAKFSPVRISPATSALPWMLMECTSLINALTVRERIHGLVIGGNAVRAELYDYSAYLMGDFRDEFLVSNQTAGGSYAVRLVSFVEASQMVPTSAQGVEEASDEKEEVLGDISSMVSEWCEGVRLDSVIFARPPVDNDTMDVFLILNDVQQALMLSAALSSKVVGGQRLMAEVVKLSDESYEHGTVYSIGSASNSQSSNSLKFHTLCRSGCTSAVVAVMGYLSAEDLSSEREGGDDDLTTTKRDLLQLARGADGVKGDDQQLFVSRLSVLSEDGETCDVNQGENVFVACVEFDSALSAERVMTALDGSMVGGRRLCAYLEQMSGALVVQRAPVDVVASKDLSSVPEESNEFVEPPAKISKSDDVSTRPEGHSCLYYEQFSPSVPSAQVSTESLSSEEAREGETPSKYTAAKGAPKLSLRTRPIGSYKSADEITNAHVKDLLSRLAGFQARAKEKNPLKAKQKLRFVSGIKQATSATKVGKTRLLLLAPNVEDSEELDERLNALLLEAAQRDIPVLYCLSKRLLGKALQMSMKQSVVAVLDPDGAYDLFKLILLAIRNKE